MEIPSAFETVGTLIHLNLRDEQLPYKYDIGQVCVSFNHESSSWLIGFVGQKSIHQDRDQQNWKNRHRFQNLQYGSILRLSNAKNNRSWLERIIPMSSSRKRDASLDSITPKYENFSSIIRRCIGTLVFIRSILVWSSHWTPRTAFSPICSAVSAPLLSQQPSVESPSMRTISILCRTTIWMKTQREIKYMNYVCAEWT